MMLSAPHNSRTDVLVPFAGHFRETSPYQGLRPRGTSDWLMIYTKNGSGYCVAGGQTLSLQAGDLVLIEPGHPHRYGVPGKGGFWDLFWVHFIARAEWRPIFTAWPVVEPGYRLFNLKESARAALLRIFPVIIRHAGAQTSHTDLVAMHYLERLMLALHEANPEKSLPILDPRLLRATQFIQANLDGTISLDALAAVAGLSKFRLSHLFSEQLGVAPHQFILNQRLRNACDLLENTKLNIGEIAYASGFSSPAHFSQQFKARMHCSPGAFREKRPLPQG